MTSDGGLSLPASVLAGVEEMLLPVDDQLRRDYPGEAMSRRPVHTVYVPAHQYHSGLGRAWGELALTAVDAGGGMEALLQAADIAPELRPVVAQRVHHKLSTEPIEDLRIDFEDGYGHHETEDDDAEAAARALRTDVDAQAAPPFTGIRFKSLEAPTRERGLRTLDLFLTTLTAGGTLPEGFVLTLAKVSAAAQVQAMVRVCEALEEARGLPGGRLGFEVQVETAPAILAPDGTAGVAGLIRAGAGRVAGLHFGTYDYSAALGIAGAYQSMEHPAADHAKAVMQLAVAGTGVHISDGSTNILPVGEPAQVRQGWALHARLVRRSLERGFYQGWDLHPAQLPSRFAATYAFYRAHAEDAAGRLAAYLAGQQGRVADEPATARALARYLRRGLDCGALSAADLHRSGLDPAQLEEVLMKHVFKADRGGESAGSPAPHASLPADHRPGGGEVLMSAIPYSVNCSILLTDLPLPERPAAAKAAGFDGVEFWWPFRSPAPDQDEVDGFVTTLTGAGVHLTGLNFYAGDMPGGDRGVLSWPERSGEFRANLDVVTAIAERTGCRAFNALYGNRVEGVDPAKHDEVGSANLALAAGAVARLGGTVLIEPVSGASAYPLRTAADATGVIDRVRTEHGADNLALLLDVYHLAGNGADVSTDIATYRDRIGHVQIADAPGRGAPGTGTLPITDWITDLRSGGYTGPVGLEYTSKAADPFAWLPRDERGGR